MKISDFFPEIVLELKNNNFIVIVLLFREVNLV